MKNWPLFGGDWPPLLRRGGQLAPLLKILDTALCTFLLPGNLQIFKCPAFIQY